MMGVVSHLVLLLVVLVNISDSNYWAPAGIARRERVIVCQYDIYYRALRTPKFEFSKSELYYCTHVVYDQNTPMDGKISHWKGPETKDQEAIISWKTRKPQPMKTLTSLRLTDTELPKLLRPVATFCESLTNYLVRYRFDGVEIDTTLLTWRPPMQFWDLYTLLAGLKIRIDMVRTRYRLLVTCVVQPNEPGRYNVRVMSRYCDFVVVQTILKPNDVNNSKILLHPSPIEMPNNAQQMSTDTIVARWLVKGLPKNKLVIAVPTYGLNFMTADPSHAELGDRAISFVTWSNHGDKLKTMFGYTPFFEVCMATNEGRFQTHVRTKGTKAYAAFSTGKQPGKKYWNWIGHEDKDTLLHKIHYINLIELRGAKVYSLQFDDYHNFCRNGKFRTSYSLWQGIIEDNLKNEKSPTASKTETSSACTAESSVVLLAMVVTLVVMWIATPE